MAFFKAKLRRNGLKLSLPVQGLCLLGNSGGGPGNTHTCPGVCGEAYRAGGNQYQPPPFIGGKPGVQNGQKHL